MSAKQATNVVVFDIGKTNAKVILFDLLERREQVVVTHPNESVSGPPYLHYDADSLESLFLDGLGRAAKSIRIDAINVATHGASGAIVTENGFALPPLDYDDPGPETVAKEYDSIRPTFSATGSPRFANGLNLGAQIFWQKQKFPERFRQAKYILTWPQYWTWRMTGVAATEITSLASHTDLWDIERNDYSSLVDDLQIRSLFPPLRQARDILGLLRADFAAAANIDYAIPVYCGVHDSNAALVPYLLPAKGARTIISTGTWITVFALGGSSARLPLEAGVMASVDVFGRVVPNFRFPGGRIYNDMGSGGSGDHREIIERLSSAGFWGEIANGDLLIRDRHGVTISREDFTPEESAALCSLALANQTLQGISWIGGAGDTVVLGPFARNSVYLHHLRSNLLPPVIPEPDHGGIAEGVATLVALE